MSNLEVMKEFLKKENAKTNLRYMLNGHKGRTLQTQQDAFRFCLYNYNTIIAFILNDTLYLNTRKYSATTSKIQSQLRNQATYTDYKIKEYEEE